MDGKQEDVLWTPAFLVLIAVMFFAAFMAIGLNSGIALYFDMQGYPTSRAGILLAVFTVSATVMRILSGDWADRFSHKRLLIAGSAFMLVGCAIPLFSEHIVAYALSRILQGVGMSLQSTVTAVLTALAVSPNRLREAQGYRGLGTALATAFGPTVAVWTVETMGGWAMFAVYTGVMLLGLILVSVVKFEDHSGDGVEEEEGQETEAASQQEDEQAGATPELANESGLIHRYFEKAAIPSSVTELMRRFIDGIASSFSVLYGISLGFDNTALFFILSSVGIITVRLFLSKWMNTATNRSVILIICLSAILGFGLVIIVPEYWAFCIAGYLWGISDGFGAPFLMSLSIRSAPKERWGVASANFYLAGDAGMAFGGMLGSLMIDALGIWILPWYVMVAGAVTLVVSKLVKLW